MLTETITYINSMLPITNGGPSEKNTLAAPEDLAHRGDSRTNEYDEKAWLPTETWRESGWPAVEINHGVQQTYRFTQFTSLSCHYSHLESCYLLVIKKINLHIIY